MLAWPVACIVPTRMGHFTIKLQVFGAHFLPKLAKKRQFLMDSELVRPSVYSSNICLCRVQLLVAIPNTTFRIYFNKIHCYANND